VTDVAPEAAPEEPSPKLVPWALSRGNFVHILWINSRLRTTETQGLVREIRGGCVYVTPTSYSPMEKATVINIDRVRNVDVIIEGEEGKDARKKAWELIKQAAGCINRRSDWDPNGFFDRMSKLSSIFPQIKQDAE
jgi:hypothetical protein